MENLFDPRESVQYMYAWLHRFYCGAIACTPTQGQAIFIAGKPGRGKTLFTNRIVGGLMGSCADASDFLLGETSWNASLLHSSVWVVDDAKSTTSYEKHRIWGTLLKKTIA